MMRSIGGKYVSLLILVVLATRDSSAGEDPCEGQGGASIEILSEGPIAIGYPIEFGVRGMAISPFTLAADTGAGPTTVPGVGTLCLDLRQNLRIVFDGIREGFPVIPDDGSFEFALEIPARAGLAGQRFHLQGVLLDPDAPNGVAITNKIQFDILPSIIESFQTTEMRDEAATTARWEGNRRVIGRVSNPRNVVFSPGPSEFLIPDPLTPAGSRLQLLYPREAGVVLPGETILGMSWGPKSNFVFASRYRDVEMKLGQASFSSLRSTFDLNFESGAENPVTLFRGDYSVPNSLDSTWHDWPEFESDFEVGPDAPGFVFEMSVPPGGDTFQLFRHRFTSVGVNRRIIAPFGANESTNPVEDTQYHTRFQVALSTTYAQSLFFDAGVTDPDYSRGRVIARQLPAGTSVRLELEGAHDDNGDGFPDVGTFTGFTEDPDRVDGHRLIRFRLSLTGDFRTGQVPIVDSVAIAYRGS